MEARVRVFGRLSTMSDAEFRVCLEAAADALAERGGELDNTHKRIKDLKRSLANAEQRISDLEDELAATQADLASAQKGGE